MRSSTETLVTAMRVLARDIQSGDGVANAAIAEAADRLAELERENAALLAELDATRKLLGVHILRSDLFSYLAWLEDHRDHGDFSVKGKDYLVLASDNTTCWGETFMEAVQVAEQHDRKLFDAARKEAQP